MSRRSFLLVIFLFSAAGSFFSSIQAKRTVSTQTLQSEISINFTDHIQAVDLEAENVLSGLRTGKSLASSMSFLVLQRDSIIEWNDYHFIPPLPSLTDEFQIKFLKTGVGEFILKKWMVVEDKYLIAIIPLHVQYKITNKYLEPSWNEEIFKQYKVILLDPSDPQSGSAIMFNDSAIFKIDHLPYLHQSHNFWSAITILVGLLSIVIFVFALFDAVRGFSKRYPGFGFLILVAVVMIVRVMMIVAEFPVRFIDSELFNAKNFASSELNPSLGDLCLNILSVLILSLYLFRSYYRFEFFQSLILNKWLRMVFTIVCVTLVLFAFLYPFVVVQTIYNNSTITLSIAQSIQFDLLRLVGLLSVIFAWVSSFFFAHVFLRLLASEQSIFKVCISIVVGCFLFGGINMVSGQPYFWSLLSGLIYLIFVLSFSLFHSLQKFQYKTFTYFFVAVLCISFNGMHAVRYYEQQGRLQDQLRFAGNFLDERDYFGEYLLNEAAGRIASDAFIQTRMATPFLGKETIAQKIKQIHLSGYFSQYTVNVALFDAIGDPIENVDSVHFSALINQYDKATYRTGYDDIFYVSGDASDFSRKYVVVVPLMKNGIKVGYVVIDLSLKRIIPESVYPELLVDDRFSEGDFGPQLLSYAIISDNQIRYSAGDFNYELFVQKHLTSLHLFTRGIIDEKYLHVGVEDLNGRISIISSPAPPLIYWLADFSFQVVLGLVIVLILLFVQGLYSFSKSGNLYLAARIQLILNLAFFLPLIAVSIITLNLATKSSQEQLNAEYLNKASRFGEVIAPTLSENGDVSEFERKFVNLATLASLDANVFSVGGKLIATSQPLIFENNLLAPFIKPSAYKRIMKGDKIFVSTERVGRLQFYVAYSALVSPETGNQLGILAVPFFQSASSLEKMQITVLANILSIFTLIFIALLTISFLVTKWLTAPLRVIAKTVGHVSLTGTNKPLEWQSDDEIGMLAKEYNQMLIKLNDSKQELERSQRERAWREIAQQVAHEIKNPLTPMKLTLQQLERSLQNENQKDEKLNKAVSTLLSQINSLDEIASSFSSFAKMPEPVMKEVELVSLVSKVADLHRQEIRIILQSSSQTARVLADERLLGRIFSNIILNALQAARPEVMPHVSVEIKTVKSCYQISFSDNGKGIDSKLSDKIFLPHFTTKQSGSGLGLAIAKQGIEQMGGKIWFETTDSGSTFFIELPIIN